mgnify:CR=1 FL=1
MQREHEFESGENQPLDGPQSEFGDFRDLPLLKPYYTSQNRF